MDHTKLSELIRARNETARSAGPFFANMQFLLDCQASGLDILAIGFGTVIGKHAKAWRTPFGLLVDDNGALVLLETDYGQKQA